MYRQLVWSAQRTLRTFSDDRMYATPEVLVAGQRSPRTLLPAEADDVLGGSEKSDGTAKTVLRTL